MTPLRFCMVTTFYPPYHFVGDAMYIYRLSHALARRGHTVDVVHDRDAYHLARRDEPAQRFPDHANVRVTAMKSPFGALSPLLTQPTARPFLKPEVRRRLQDGEYDVIHYHNMSLIGSTALGLAAASSSTRRTSTGSCARCTSCGNSTANRAIRRSAWLARSTAGARRSCGAIPGASRATSHTSTGSSRPAASRGSDT
jgi:hypothetical protein